MSQPCCSEDAFFVNFVRQNIPQTILTIHMFFSGGHTLHHKEDHGSEAAESVSVRLGD